MANIRLEVVLGIPFFNFSMTDICFAEREFVWRTYTAAKTLLTIRRVEIIDKKEFAMAVSNVENETFVMHVAALAKATIIPIYHFYQAQVALLISEEIRILVEYFDFSNLFSLDSAAELPEYIRINNHPINLLDNK